MKALLQYVTGVETVQGNSIAVTFDTGTDAAGVAANSCGRGLCLSTRIEEEYFFFREVDVLIGEKDFTMP